MTSIISIILNFIREKWGNRIIKIRRFPPTRVMHAHLLGLTLALIAILIAIPLFNYQEISSTNNLEASTSSTSPEPYVWVLLIILFLLGSYIIGGFYVIIIGIVLILLLILPNFKTLVWDAFCHTASWYIGGYLFGAVFAILYNDLIYLHTITVNCKRVKFHFAFDPKLKINIIKSPILNEETVNTNDIVPEDKVYNYVLGDNYPKHPYTIVFVANPFIEVPIIEDTKANGNKKNPPKFRYEPDPIMQNMDLFLRSVETALASFEQDDVLGRPEIWSRIRIVAVFCPELLNEGDKSKVTLVQPLSAYIDGELVVNLLVPKDGMWINFKEILKKIPPSEIAKELTQEEKDKINDAINRTIKEADVIYALSASPLYTRSNARFTDWSENLHLQINDPRGVKFEFDPDPYNSKNGEIEKNKISASSAINSVHEEYATFVPGRVALNVVGANSKTYIHEFGHAMSSALTGAITDEYFDKYESINDTTIAGIGAATNPGICKGDPVSPNINIPFYVNLIERISKSKLIPVHKVFAKYKDTIYNSDRDHPSSEEDWDSYFPEKKPAYAGCMMDRTYGSYRFDKLISDFMYDRLIAKINRSPKVSPPMQLLQPIVVKELKLNLHYFDPTPISMLHPITDIDKEDTL